MMSKIVVIGEAWGAAEAEKREPFQGASGRLLRGVMKQVGIDPRDCFFTNVFNLQPKPNNDVKNLCGPKSAGAPGLPPIAQGFYLLPQYLSELERLRAELSREQPNLIISLGNTPLWFLTGKYGIKKVRGTQIETKYGKAIPVLHPAAVLRDMSQRPAFLADLEKCKRHAEYPEIRRPARRLYLEPSLADLEWFELEHIVPSRRLSVDIESYGNSITCIGFAPRRDIAICVPFAAVGKPGQNYWPTALEELKAWIIVRRWLSYPTVEYVGQNFMYDMKFMFSRMGLPVKGEVHDTMLMHHALQPEMEKSLGFLGSIYTEEMSWKYMRKTATIKKED